MSADEVITHVCSYPPGTTVVLTHDQMDTLRASKWWLHLDGLPGDSGRIAGRNFQEESF